MSHSGVLSFPNSHTIEQVKRNAKRHSKDQCIPLNKALDRMASISMGFPEGKIKWAEAIKAVELAHNYYSLPTDFKIPQESRNAFTEGLIVSIDVKDAQNFNETGPWVLDEKLKMLMAPTLIAIYALSGAEEDGRKLPNEDDWSYSLDGLMWPKIYRYNGILPLNDVIQVVRDICDRNFFPPDFIWMRGNKVELPNHITL